MKDVVKKVIILGSGALKMVKQVSLITQAPSSESFERGRC